MTFLPWQFIVVAPCSRELNPDLSALILLHAKTAKRRRNARLQLIAQPFDSSGDSRLCSLIPRDQAMWHLHDDIYLRHNVRR